MLGIGTSNNPCEDNYHGGTAFSEVEVKNVATYLQTIPKLVSYWSVHAYGQLILTPSSYTSNLPNDFKEMVSYILSHFSINYLIISTPHWRWWEFRLSSFHGSIRNVHPLNWKSIKRVWITISNLSTQRKRCNSFYISFYNTHSSF